MGFSYGLPSGYVKIAIENDHRNSGFSHEKWVDLSIAMLNYQRVRG